MNLEDIVKILDNKLEKDIAYSWDNVGLLVAGSNKDVRRILTTLEVTRDVIEEAVSKDIDLIISHHPIFMKETRKLIYNECYQNIAINLIKNNIALYACHTNFDKLDKGLNDFVIDLLDIKDKNYLISDVNSEDYKMGRIANLKHKMKLLDFISYIKELYNLEDVRYTGKYDLVIEKIGLVTGSGVDFAKYAFDKGVDIFLTGDMKYHQAQESLFYGHNIMDIGHYGSEKFFSPAISKTLNGVFENIEILESKKNLNPMKTYF